MSIDKIGDFLTIIRNGIMASKKVVIIPYSNLRFEITKILKNEGFIKDFVVEDADPIRKKIKVSLKYVDGESVIHEIKGRSRPGKRFYVGFKGLEPVIGGLGLLILTTSKGILTDKKAKELSIGGEILCSIW